MSPFGLPDRLFAPAPAAERVAFLRAQPFAHRGLHGGGIIENSRAAFASAIAAGHGIECDVQAARDGEAFVFHDDQLDRLTAEGGPVAGRSADALGRIRLRGTEETVPRLSEVLSLVAGRVPLLIEAKAPQGRVAPLCLSVRHALEGYRGAVAVMSFDPQVPRWFADQAPGRVRGLVVSEAGDRRWRPRLRRHAELWKARPDFLAYDVRDLPSPFAAATRERGVPLLSWTVRDAQSEAVALAHADEIIYEREAA